MRPAFPTLACLAAVTIAAACNGPDPLIPPSLDPTGAYSASEFTVTTGSDTIDELAAGVTLTITLAPDGTTSGSLFSPEGSPTPLDLAGTWSLDGDVVTFHQQALDNVVQHIQFHVSPQQLQGEAQVGGGTVRMTLSQ